MLDRQQGECPATPKAAAMELDDDAEIVGVDGGAIGSDGQPIFLRCVTDQTVKVGTRARFLAEIISSSALHVTWLFNSQPVFLPGEEIHGRFKILQEGNFYCLEISPVAVEDEGAWTCRAVLADDSSSEGVSATAQLRVMVPKSYKRPEFVEELQAVLTEEGTVSLECKVVGIPTPVLHWFKDGKEIKAGDVFAFRGPQESSTPEEAATSLGVYSCEAVNCVGKAVSVSQVRVRNPAQPASQSKTDSIGPPVIIEEPFSQKVRVGEDVRFTVRVMVPPLPSQVKWFNKDVAKEAGPKYVVGEDGHGGYSLDITPTDIDDDGEWKVAIKNQGVEAESSASAVLTLVVPKNYRPPRFLESLKAVLTEEGLVSFECKVVGFPTPQLQWFKDGQELKPGDVYQLSGTNSLGSYSCVARNCMGTAVSAAELTVDDIQNQLNEEERRQLMDAHRPPVFSQGLRSAEARVGDAMRLTVQVSSTTDAFLVTWFHNDEPVDSDEAQHKFRSWKEDSGLCHLDVDPLEFSDEGDWKCIVINDFGHAVTSCSVKLAVPKFFRKPHFLEPLRAVLSDEGTVNLECKVIGVPQPSLKWYKDGVELKPGDIHRIMSGQDGTCCLGTYTCEAHNCMGTASSSAALLGFEDRPEAEQNVELAQQEEMLDSEHRNYMTELHPRIARNPSLSTIQEERSSQISLYETARQEEEEKAEISVSLDGREVSVSLYETPDLTEEEAQQIVELFAEELSERISFKNTTELPPLRFTRETAASGSLLMEAVVIDVPIEFANGCDNSSAARTLSDYEEAPTEADIEELSAMEALIVEEADQRDQPYFLDDLTIPDLPYEVGDVRRSITGLQEAFFVQETGLAQQVESFSGGATPVAMSPPRRLSVDGYAMGEEEEVRILLDGIQSPVDVDYYSPLEYSDSCSIPSTSPQPDWPAEEVTSRAAIDKPVEMQAGGAAGPVPEEVTTGDAQPKTAETAEILPAPVIEETEAVVELIAGQQEDVVMESCNRSLVESELSAIQHLAEVDQNLTSGETAGPMGSEERMEERQAIVGEESSCWMVASRTDVQQEILTADAVIDEPVLADHHPAGDNVSNDYPSTSSAGNLSAAREVDQGQVDKAPGSNSGITLASGGPSSSLKGTGDPAATDRRSAPSSPGFSQRSATGQVSPFETPAVGGGKQMAMDEMEESIIARKETKESVSEEKVAETAQEVEELELVKEAQKIVDEQLNEEAIRKENEKKERLEQKVKEEENLQREAEERQIEEQIMAKLEKEKEEQLRKDLEEEERLKKEREEEEERLRDEAEKVAAMIEEEEKKRVEAEEQERMEREAAEEKEAEEQEKLKKEMEEKEKLQREAEEEERLKKESEEQDRIKKESEERERMEKEAEEEERLRKQVEEQERLKKEAEEKAKLEEEEKDRLLKEEEERVRKEAEEQERLKLEEEERLKKEVEEQERLKKEEEEAKLEREAEERDRLKKEAEEQDRLRKEAEEKAKLQKEAEEQDRLKKEAEEEQSRITKEAEEQKHLKKEAEEKAKLAAEEEDRLRKEEQERVRKEAEEQDRIKREEEERLEKETEEKAKLEKEEQDRLVKEEQERARKEEEERLKLEAEEKEAEEQDRLRKEAEEKAKLEEQDRIKKEAEEQERLKKEEEDRLGKEAEAKAKLEKEEQDRLLLEEQESARKEAEEQERLKLEAKQKEEEERAKREKEELMEKEKLQKETEENDRLKKESEGSQQFETREDIGESEQIEKATLQELSVAQQKETRPVPDEEAVISQSKDERAESRVASLATQKSIESSSHKVLEGPLRQVKESGRLSGQSSLDKSDADRRPLTEDERIQKQIDEEKMARRKEAAERLLREQEVKWMAEQAAQPAQEPSSSSRHEERLRLEQAQLHQTVEEHIRKQQQEEEQIQRDVEAEENRAKKQKEEELRVRLEEAEKVRKELEVQERLRQEEKEKREEEAERIRKEKETEERILMEEERVRLEEEIERLEAERIRMKEERKQRQAKEEEEERMRKKKEREERRKREQEEEERMRLEEEEQMRAMKEEREKTRKLKEEQEEKMLREIEERAQRKKEENERIRKEQEEEERKKKEEERLLREEEEKKRQAEEEKARKEAEEKAKEKEEKRKKLEEEKRKRDEEEQKIKEESRKQKEEEAKRIQEEQEEKERKRAAEAEEQKSRTEELEEIQVKKEKELQVMSADKEMESAEQEEGPTLVEDKKEMKEKEIELGKAEAKEEKEGIKEAEENEKKLKVQEEEKRKEKKEAEEKKLQEQKAKEEEEKKKLKEQQEQQQRKEAERQEQERRETEEKKLKEEQEKQLKEAETKKRLEEEQKVAGKKKAKEQQEMEERKLKEKEAEETKLKEQKAKEEEEKKRKEREEIEKKKQKEAEEMKLKEKEEKERKEIEEKERQEAEVKKMKEQKVAEEKKLKEQKAKEEEEKKLKEAEEKKLKERKEAEEKKVKEQQEKERKEAEEKKVKEQKAKEEEEKKLKEKQEKEQKEAEEKRRKQEEETKLKEKQEKERKKAEEKKQKEQKEAEEKKLKEQQERKEVEEKKLKEKEVEEKKLREQKAKEEEENEAKKKAKKEADKKKSTADEDKPKESRKKKTVEFVATPQVPVQKEEPPQPEEVSHPSIRADEEPKTRRERRRRPDIEPILETIDDASPIRSRERTETDNSTAVRRRPIPTVYDPKTGSYSPSRLDSRPTYQTPSDRISAGARLGRDDFRQGIRSLSAGIVHHSHLDRPGYQHESIAMTLHGARPRPQQVELEHDVSFHHSLCIISDMKTNSYIQMCRYTLA